MIIFNRIGLSILCVWSLLAIILKYIFYFSFSPTFACHIAPGVYSEWKKLWKKPNSNLTEISNRMHIAHLSTVKERKKKEEEVKIVKKLRNGRVMKLNQHIR